MTVARSLIVDPVEPGYYHCVSRCVRRAFLCGVDNLTGRDCSHRKQWIEDRLVELAQLFALYVYAYAVMSNHLHVVVQLDPGAALTWSAEEVAERWVKLFPVRVDGKPDEEANAQRRANLLGDARRLATCRARLASLSWFMKCLNEPIARRANREDAVTGHFWEGRYSCQPLLDEAAPLACMAYVDLNPIRAGIAEDLPSTEHTSITQRIVAVESDHAAADEPLRRVAGNVAEAELTLSVADYLELVDWTGRLVHEGKRGVIAGAAPPILAALGIDAADWKREAVLPTRRAWRVVGAVTDAVAKAQAIGQRWFKGYRRLRVATAGIR